jgi:hypothetical protein
MPSTISFNSYNLQTANIITEKILHTSTPDFDLLTEQKARRNGSFIMANYWTKKTIIASGHIIGTSVSDLDSRIDTLKRNLAGQELNLDIGYSGGTRRYIATAKKLDIEREHYNNYWCPFSIEFSCVDPFGRATTPLSYEILNQTTSPVSLTVPISGSVPAYPTLTIYFDAVNTVSVVQIENITTGDIMTITRSFAASSTLIINCNTLSVTYNAADQDYSGIFPDFVLGNNVIEATVTGTSFQLDLTVSYIPLYT